jgi:hypothetical protein
MTLPMLECRRRHWDVGTVLERVAIDESARQGAALGLLLDRAAPGRAAYGLGDPALHLDADRCGKFFRNCFNPIETG